jgi:hypothetical protein
MASFIWTVSIIVQYESQHEKAFQNLRKGIESQQKQQSIRFFLLKHLIDEGRVEIEKLDCSLNPPHEFKPETQFITTNFFKKGVPVIKDFFAKYSLSESSDHHFILTWGHGAGFGLFRDGFPPEVPKKIAREITYLRRLFAASTLGFNADVVQSKYKEYLSTHGDTASFSEFIQRKGFNIVTIDDLNTAIFETFGKAEKRIEFMFCMNCFMNMFETGYTLKNHVDHLISSETYQMWYGPDYKKMFDELIRIDYSKEEHVAKFAKLTVESYIDKYKEPVLRSEIKQIYIGTLDIDFEELSLTVCRLSSYTQVNEKINSIAKHLVIQKSQDLYRHIGRAKRKCREVSIGETLGIIDILNFFEQLSFENGINQQLKVLLNDLLQFIAVPGSVVIAHHAWKNACELTIVDDQLAAICPKGFSIFFPNNKDDSITNDFVKFFMETFYRETQNRNIWEGKSSFIKDSEWNNFVIEFYDLSI